MPEIDPSDRTTVLAHYYRAMVGRADVWRMRLDTTTNWAIGSMAAILSFTLSSETVPHYVLFIASLMTASFLVLEARRLTFYHLWQQRVLLLENGLMRPALGGRIDTAIREPSGEDASQSSPTDLADTLDPHLGRTVPTMPLTKAIARRLRRVYLYLFGVQLLAWLLKLANHPTPIQSWGELVGRADMGVLGGELVFGVAGVVFTVAVLTAVTRGGIDRDPA